MSDNDDISLVDSTHRIKWEISKEKFDNCDFPNKISSPDYAIDIDGEKSQWYISMRPKGYKENKNKGYKENKNKVRISLKKRRSDKSYKVSYQFGIETQNGLWPEELLNKLYSRRPLSRVISFGSMADGVHYGWGSSLCTIEKFKEYFVDDKVTVVAFIVIYAEGDKHLDHMKIADDFTATMRSMSTFESLSDFTLISENTHIPCHRVILATRSKYFEALFRNEPSRKETKMDESPEVVKTMLEYMYKGLIPKDIDEKALGLILMSDKYGLDLLTMACEKSLVNNLTADNAVETLITIDKIKHVSKEEHRKKILNFIKKEADVVAKPQDWKKFVQTYPDLITEILLFK